jgi:peptidoglycan hydrolase-like protein with peptidoglycan-binding domain
MVLTGYGGSETQKAIFDYQTTHGLDMTGQFDPLTVAKLNTFRPAPDYTLGRALIPIILSFITKGAIPMTADQITGVLRAILTAIGGYVVGKGIVDQTTATEIIGAVLTLVGAGWSIYSNRPKVIVPLSAK